jgi:hypothetical protein
LLKTAAHFCPLVKCFLLFSKETVKRKIPRTFLWYEVSFLSSYLNDIGRQAGNYLCPGSRALFTPKQISAARQSEGESSAQIPRSSRNLKSGTENWVRSCNSD